MTLVILVGERNSRNAQEKLHCREAVRDVSSKPASSLEMEWP